MSSELQDQEPSSVDFERMSKRRYRWVYVLGGLVVAAGVIGWFALRAIEREQQQKLNTAWSELNACLLGGALAPGETPAARVRNTQLAVMAVPREKRAKLGEYSWPATCGSYGHAVAEVLRAKGATDGLADSAEKLAKAVKDEKGDTADLTTPIEKAFADAAAMGLKASDAPNVKAPPASVSPLTLDSLPVTARLLSKTVNLANLRMQPFPHPTMWFVLDQADTGEGPLLCSASAAGSKIACKKLPESAAKLTPGLRLWGTVEDGAEPMLFAGDRGSAGILRLPEGGKVAETMTYGAHARKDGSAALLVWNEKAEEVRLANHAKDGAPVEKKLLAKDDIGNPYYTAGLFWGWLVYEAYSKEAEEIRFYARNLQDGAGEPGAVVDAGKIWEPGVIRSYQEEPNLMGCRTDKGIAVVVGGRSRDSVSFLADGKWTTPVPSEQAGGQLTCRGLEATTTRTRFVQKQEKYWPAVTQSRCNVSSCTLGSVQLEDLIPGLYEIAPAETRQVQAVDVDGNLALVWHGGDAGGLRMRFGPIERMKDVPDAVLYDDVVQEGKRVISNLLEMRVLPGQGFSLVFLSTINGVFVLRIDPKGVATPATISM